MKIAKLAQRLVMLARATANPNALPGGQTILDSTFPALVCDNHGILWTRAASGTTSGVALNGAPATQSASSSPAAGNQATAAAPADGTGQNAKNVLVRISWSVGDTAAIAGGLKVVIRDGASGVGAILWQKEIGPLPVNSFQHGSEAWPLGVGIPGSANNVMTAEFTAAPAGTGFQSVALTTYLAT